MAKNATVGSHWTFLSSVGLASGPGIDEAWLVRPSAPRLRRDDGLIAPSYRPLQWGRTTRPGSTARPCSVSIHPPAVSIRQFPSMATDGGRRGPLDSRFRIPEHRRRPGVRFPGSNAAEDCPRSASDIGGGEPARSGGGSGEAGRRGPVSAAGVGASGTEGMRSVPGASGAAWMGSVPTPRTLAPRRLRKST